MYFNPNKIVNSLLCCNNFKFPMYKNHYVTGKNIWLFPENTACISSSLPYSYSQEAGKRAPNKKYIRAAKP